jgi:signal transduction histidine kinase
MIISKQFTVSDTNGKMTKKLLNKTTSNLVIFSVIILLIAAPAFYFISKKMYVDETDETLSLFIDEFKEYYLPKFETTEIAVLNKYNRSINILPYHGVKKDTFFTKVYYDKIEDEHEAYRELNTPVIIEGKYYTFQARINMIENQDMVMNIAILFIGMIAVLLFGMLLINEIAARKLWKPFYDTLNQIENFELDKNKTPSFLETQIVEFSRLNNSVKKLIERNLLMYKSQREFVENAAHELQTPLALFQTKIDSLSQLDISEAQSRLLDSLNNDVSRLNRLNKNLLLLSRIENEGYPSVEKLVLNNAVQKHFDFFNEQAAAKRIQIKTQFEEAIKIQSNSALLDILISNLFLNAIRHNVNNGEIIIAITNDSLSFQNTGQKDALEQDRLFSRFAKINPSGHGNGLGLAIVKKIVEINQWTIDYTFIENRHVFTIKF